MNIQWRCGTKRQRDANVTLDPDRVGGGVGCVGLELVGSARGGRAMVRNWLGGVAACNGVTQSGCVPQTIVRFTLTRSDLVRGQTRAAVRNGYLLCCYLVTAALLLAWSFLRAADNEPPFVTLMIGVISVFVFALGIYPATFAVLLLMSFGNQSGLLCEHEIEIKEEGLVERTKVNEGVHRWAGLYKVSRAKNVLYIFVNANQMHVIPGRGFATPGGNGSVWIGD